MNRSILRTWLVRATLPVMIAMVAACGAAASTPPVPTPSASETPAQNPSATPIASATPTVQPTPGRIALKAYFLLFTGSDESPGQLVPVNREVDRTAAVARAAVERLLAGPTEDERAHDLRLGTIGTSIPKGTRLLGIDIGGGIATVDLSGEFASGDIRGDDRESWALRLAQVTYTLTQFPTIDGVRFRLDGKPTKAIEGHEGSPIDPATRAAYTDQLPGIFVDHPAWGAAITDPLTVSGIAQIVAEPPQFQAAFVDRTTDKIIVQQTVRAPCDTGCWQPPGGGEFQFRLSIPQGAIRGNMLLRVWEISARDGSHINVLDYPLR
jgi:spore germination protein GerM